MQDEDPLHQQHDLALYIKSQHLHIPVLAPAAFQGLNYLDERSPLVPQLQASPWPQNFRTGTYPKYNGSADPTQYTMSYQVAITSSGGNNATTAKSFIIALN
jgi:hypothetical protein